MLNGAGGSNDTLAAKITSGVYAGVSNTAVASGSESMPIQPETTSIENIKLQAVNSGIYASKLTTEVFVNAKDMTGITKIASNYSDANLTIQNLTTLDDGGSARPVSDMTVGMEYTGNADSNWEESDLHVYFDQDYLTTQTTFGKPSIDFKLMNEDAYDATITSAGGVRPLDGVYVFQMDFRLNGKTYSLAPYLLVDEPANGDGSQVSTYAQQLVAVQKAIVALKAANPTDVALQSLSAQDGVPFTSDISPATGQLRQGTTITLTVDGSTANVPNSLTVAATDLQLVRSPLATVANNNRYERAEPTPALTGKTLEINVALEKIGLAGDGGDLVIGSMNKTVNNAWDAVNTTTDTVSGINQFNVTVYGANDKSSSLSSLASTNNNLKTVVVTTAAAQTGTYANLTIGNSKTEFDKKVNSSTAAVPAVYAGVSPITGLPVEVSAAVAATTETIGVTKGTPSAFNANALKDVQTFDASGLKGNLTLFAALSSEVTAKYLNVLDVQANPAEDNVAFAYTGGTGNDYINLYLDPSNLALPGTVNREDLTLNVSGGAGNDELVTYIGTTGEGEAQWYQNQKINAVLSLVSGEATGQLVVNGNDGNDTIRTIGAGDFAINGGLGNDTIYSDNSGVQGKSGSNAGRAAWVFNAIDTDDAGPGAANVNNLISQARASTTTGVVNLHLTVNYRDIVKTVVVANSAGAQSGVVVTDLQIRQAIQDAINNDAVLSKLLVAKEGPSGSLVVSSLTDGDVSATPADNFKVSLSSTALTTGQSALGLLQINTTQANALGFAADSDADATTTTNLAIAFGRFDASTATNGAATGGVSDGAAIIGGDSFAPSDNLIVGGAGNDVIVLSTTGYKSTTPATTASMLVSSNETVAYGANFGADTIVNFDSTLNEAGTPIWDGGTEEVVTLTFSASDGDPAAETIVFDGVTVNLAAPTLAGIIPALDVGTQFVTQYNAAANTAWTAVNGAAGVVVLTRKVPGNVADLTTAAFTGNFFAAAVDPDGNGTVGIAIVQGTDTVVPATTSSFTVTYDTATTALVTPAPALAGITGEIAGDGALSLATKLAATVTAGYTNTGVVTIGTGTSYSVTFTAVALGATALPVDTAFGLGATPADGVNGTFVGVAGTAATTSVPVATIAPAGPGEGYDKLDFVTIGGDINATSSNFNSLVLDKSIVVAARTTANDTATEVAALFTDSATAMTHVYVAYTPLHVAGAPGVPPAADATGTTNVGYVYAVTDAVGTGTGSVTATLMGTIDLADTTWASLHAINFV